ncbi:DUF1153 domain-containing protein [Alphaproteobacteria bacterium KMM 3653]|uniref:DUF1153 domain-containing protein n=1 Tax=Harenicola maris TaxID=2841044 RepID=A0AAP2CPE1_9RHOB|nr:DUF1153 domain-containing protein [Harenicola maris]
MFLKRIDGPRAVTLPDGSTMTRADLPDVKTQRWVASRKARVVRAVEYGLISNEEAQELYNLSGEELETWVNTAKIHGDRALRATSVQKYRLPPETGKT